MNSLDCRKLNIAHLSISMNTIGKHSSDKYTIYIRFADHKDGDCHLLECSSLDQVEPIINDYIESLGK